MPIGGPLDDLPDDPDPVRFPRHDHPVLVAAYEFVTVCERNGIAYFDPITGDVVVPSKPRLLGRHLAAALVVVCRYLEDNFLEASVHYERTLLPQFRGAAPESARGELANLVTWGLVTCERGRYAVTPLGHRFVHNRVALPVRDRRRKGQHVRFEGPTMRISTILGRTRYLTLMAKDYTDREVT